MADLMTIDEELLHEITNTMSYVEMLDWCNTNPHFKNLCNDPSSLIYQLLEAKRQEEVVAEIQLMHDIPGLSSAEYGIGIYIPTLNWRNYFVPRVFVNLFTRDEYVDEMIDVIAGKTHRRFTLWHYADPDLLIVYWRESDTVLIRADQLNFGTIIDADLFAAILESGLRAYNRGIEGGRVAIFRDLSSRLVIDPYE